MKQFILIHAVSPSNLTQIDSVCVPTSRIEGICPASDVENLSSINLIDGGSYRVTETIEEIQALIYPSEFIEFSAFRNDEVTQTDTVLLRKTVVKAIILSHQTGLEEKWAIETNEGIYVTPHSFEYLKGRLSHD